MAAADDDFDDLMDDIDFDIDGDGGGRSTSGVASGKPKNLVFSTGLDVASGVKESLNPWDNIRDILRELMPSAISSEYSDLEDALSDIKDETEKGIEEIKGSLKTVSKAISGLLPEGNIKEKLKAFGTDDIASSDYKSKEEEEQAKINQAIMEALGASEEADKQRDMVKEAAEEHRQANSQMMLKHIYAQLKVANNFDNKLTEKYYFKSLELQYKQLYKTAELVELTKVGWDSNRKQIESLIINTSIPDMVKLKVLQAANDRRLGARAKRSYLGTYFRRFNPFENLTKNIKSNIRQQVSLAKESLEMAMMGVDSIQMMKDMTADMGVTPAVMIGNMIGEKIRQSTVGKLGEKLGQTRQGKRFIFNFKDFMADPRTFIEGLKGKVTGQGIGGDALRSGLGWLARMTGTPDKKRVDFVNENLDDAKAFDGRVHQAIVKVIPGLLTDIRSAVIAGFKTSNADLERHRVIYDNATGRFSTKKRIKQRLMVGLNKSIRKDGYQYYAQQLVDSFAKSVPNISFTTKEKQYIAMAIAKTLMNSSTTSVSPNVLNSRGLHGNLLAISNNNTGLVNKFKIAATGLIQLAREDSYVFDDIKNQLEGLRRSLPNIHDRLRDMHASGNMDLARELGLVKQDADSGDWSLNEEGNDNAILNAIGRLRFSGDELDPNATRRLTPQEQHAQELQSFRENITRGWNRVTDELRQTEAGRAVVDRVERGVNFIRDSKTAQNARNAVRSVDERYGISSRIDRARGWMAEREGELIALLNQDDEAFKQTLMEKKASIESIMTWENFKNKPKEIQEKLRNKFKDMQNTYVVL